MTGRGACARYAERHRLAGLCVKCPLPIATSAKTGKLSIYCAACLKKSAERRKRHRAARPDLKRGAEWRYQLSHRTNGLCVCCPRPVAVSEKTLEDSIRCEVHQAQHAEANARYRRKLKARRA